jgi:hypothetical protein
MYDLIHALHLVYRMAFKRLLDPAEIAKLTLFAAENQMMNGAVLHANLGQVST